MGAFGGLILTNKGRALQTKAQTGAQLHYTRVAIGDGSLNGQSILDLNALISQKKTMPVSKLRILTEGKAVVGSVLSNQDLTTGFYFRELGVFAQDPDLGEVLYCYANAGANAEYIPAAGGSDIIEKFIDAVVIIGNAANVTATIDESLIFLTQQDFNNHRNTEVLDHPDGSVTDAKIGSRAIDDTIAAAAGADTPTRLWSKLANMIKKITGEDKWYTAPVRTIRQLYADLTTVQQTANGAQTAATAAQNTANSSQIAANTAWEKADAAQGTASGALIRANASLPKDGSEAMTGPLSVQNYTGRKIYAGEWADLSSNGGGHALFANNAYTINADEWIFANTHPVLGARGVRLAIGRGIEYFDTGAIPTTAGATFTPVWRKIWHEDNDGSGSGLDADLLRGVALGRILKGMGDQPHNLSPNKQIVYRVVGDGAGMLYPGPYGIGASLSSDAGSGSYTLHFYYLNGTLFTQQTADGGAITLAGWTKCWTSANINPVSKSGDTIDGSLVFTVNGTGVILRDADGATQRNGIVLGADDAIGVGDPANLLRLRGSTLKFYNGADNDVYHTGNINPVSKNGDTINGWFEVHKNIGSNPDALYDTAQIEARCTDSGVVAYSLHRANSSSAMILHKEPGKLRVRFDNDTTDPEIWHNGNAPSLMNRQAGYLKLPNGLIYMWGITTVPAQTSQVVSLPTTIPTANGFLNASCSGYGNSNTTQLAAPMIMDRDNSTIIVTNPWTSDRSVWWSIIVH